MRPSTVRRQPAGQPIGGQYATRERSSSGLYLPDSEDPWLNPAPEPEPEPVVDPETAALHARIELADTVSTAVSPFSGTAGYDAYNEADRALLDNHGSHDKAVIALGTQLAARGEELAGITAEQVATSREERLTEIETRHAAAHTAYNDLHTSAAGDLGTRRTEVRSQLWKVKKGEDTEALMAEYSAVSIELQQALDTNRDELNRLGREMNELSSLKYDVHNGVDEESIKNRRQLSDGYLQAIAEVRDLGGAQMVWHHKAAKKARTAFDEASAIFPTDWIEASNTYKPDSHINTEVVLPKVSSRRAHYSPRKLEKTRKKEVSKGIHTSRSRRGSAHEDLELHGRSSNARFEYVELTEEEVSANRNVMADDNPVWRTEYEVADRYVTRGYVDDDTPPRVGRGWEQWTHPEDPDRQSWRRPRYRMALKDLEALPEVTTNAAPIRSEGRSSTFAVSAHELSHRFEHSVPGISKLENQFVKRRTTDAETGERDKLVRLYPRSREIARPDTFPTAYIGKQYDDDRFNEVLSMGTQAIFGGDTGGLDAGSGKYEADHEMRDFVLGVMASVGRHNPNAPKK